MMYNYLSLPLAIGVILFDTTFGVSLEVPVNKNSQQIPFESPALVLNQKATEISSTTATVQKSNYLGLMNAGYVANKKENYLMAINYFQQALRIEPGDSKAIKAISTVSTYGFDLYMQSGYAADKIRDYTTALQNFQKALQLKPDSWYAKQAVSNVTGYLAQQPVNPSKTENKGNGFSLWLMLIGIGAASVLSAGLLFYLFKKTGSPLEEPEIPDLESEESFESSSESEDLASAKLIDSTTNDSEEEEEEITTNLNSKSTTSNTTSNAKSALTPPASSTTESNQTSSLVSPTQSLAKIDIVPELIQDLDKSDRSIRRKAVWELAQRGDSRAMKHLVELMMEVDSQERGLILEAMTQIAGRTLKPMNKALMMSLQDDNSQVKQNAIRDLTRVYDLMSQVTKRLSLAVEDSDSQVQETAKWALKKLNQMPSNSNWSPKASSNEHQTMKEHIPQNGTNGTNGNSRVSEQQFPLG